LQCFLLPRRYNARYKHTSKRSIVANKGQFRHCPTTTHVGCFNDKMAPNPDRVFGTRMANNLNIEQCAANCRQEGFYYIGYQWQIQCWCGRKEEDAKRHGASELCVNGKGGPQTNPSPAVFDLYIVGAAAGTGPASTDLGCFHNDVEDPVFSVRKFPNHQSVGECSASCKSDHYDQFGIQGSECWCGMEADMAKTTRFGTSVFCVDGRGGDSSFELYRIN